MSGTQEIDKQNLLEALASVLGGTDALLLGTDEDPRFLVFQEIARKINCVTGLMNLCFYMFTRDQLNLDISLCPLVEEIPTYEYLLEEWLEDGYLSTLLRQTDWLCFDSPVLKRHYASYTLVSKGIFYGILVIELGGIELSDVDYALMRVILQMGLLKLEYLDVDRDANERQLTDEAQFETEMRLALQSERSKQELMRGQQVLLKQQVAEKTLEYKVAKEKAERSNRIKGEFLANISHELRTPLHGILSFARLGTSRASRLSPEEIIRYFDSIVISGERLQGLLDNLLDLSKLEHGQFSFDLMTVRLLPLLEEVTAGLQASLGEKQLTLEQQVSELVDEVYADPIRVSQIFYNLLLNAIKFSPPGGKIELDVELHKATAQNYVKLTLSNQTEELPEGDLDVIFEAFVQSDAHKTGAGGTGLGLAIVKQLIEGMRGSIRVEQTHEKIQFVVLLPEFS